MQGFLDLENAEMLCSENNERSAQTQQKKQTFSDTYCDGRAGGRGAAESVWDLVTLPAPLETIAMILCVPALAQRFYPPESVAAQPPAESGMVERAAIEHRVVGASVTTAAQSATALKEFMMETMLAGVRLSPSSVLQQSYAQPKCDKLLPGPGIANEKNRSSSGGHHRRRPGPRR